MNILFTICGRAGSKGFKNKNLKRMRGVPLAYYTLAAIKRYADEHPQDTAAVAVNTDSVPLEDLMREQSAIPVRFVQRKPDLAGDAVPKVDVIRDTLLACGDFSPDVVVDLDITSPVRRVQDIENCLSEYRKGVYDLVFSVVEARRSPYFNMVESKSDGFYRMICRSAYTARQQAPRSYELNASIYAYRPEFLKGRMEGTILDHRCGICVMPDYLVLDIDSEEDFTMMQYLHEYFCQVDAALMDVYLTAKSMTK